MKLHEKHCVRCGDGIMRTGQVIWLHPGGIFAVLKFATKQGTTYHESFLLNRSTPEDNLPSGRSLGKRYTPDEDAQIMASKDIPKLARVLGRDPGSLYSRRQQIRKRQRGAHK